MLGLVLIINSKITERIIRIHGIPNVYTETTEQTGFGAWVLLRKRERGRVYFVIAFTRRYK